MKIIAKGIQILPAVSDKTQGWIRSGPVDLDLFSLSNLFLTISGVISTVLSTWSTFRLTCAWQYFGTLIFELFLFFYFYADNLKVSTIVSINFFLEKWFKFCVKIGFEVENLC